MADFEEYKDLGLLGKREAIAKYGRYAMDIDKLEDNTIRLKLKGVKDYSSSHYIFVDYYIEFLKDRATVRYFLYNSHSRNVEKKVLEYLYSEYTSIEFAGIFGKISELWNNESPTFSFYFYDGENLKSYISLPEPDTRAFRIASNTEIYNEWTTKLNGVADSANLLLTEYNKNPEINTNVSTNSNQPEDVQQQAAQPVPNPVQQEAVQPVPDPVQQEAVQPVPDSVQQQAAPSASQTAVFSAPEEIKKYKELLDMGAITQEEYDAKKKQLLGL